MHTVARLAQSVEHETLNLRVVGSSPMLGVSFIVKNNWSFSSYYLDYVEKIVIVWVHKLLHDVQ